MAFLSFYAVRAWNPDLWHPFFGGEKPMDFAYLNAVIKSTYMPAYDPWFAGGFLNYYYFGQFIVASLIKLTGIVPSVAYNLAVPLIFALTIGGAFSVVYNLAAARVKNREGVQPELRPKWQSPVVAGLTGSLFVAVIGNMDGIVQAVQGVWRVTVRDLPFWSRAEGYNFWRSSRMIDTSSPDAHDLCGGCEIIEFPFFSFLYGDLHAHMIALPFAILAIGVGLSLVLRRPGASDWLLQWVGLGVLALIVGALFTINSWDYPTYLILALAIVLLVEYLRHRRLSLNVAAKGIFKAGLLVVVSLLVMAPFHLNYIGSIEFPFVQRNEFRTPLYQYLGIHGIFIFVVLSFLLLQLHRKYQFFSWASLRRMPLATRGARRLMYLRDRGTPRSLYLIFSAALLISLAAVGLHTLSFLVLLLLMAMPLVRRHLARAGDKDRVDLFAFVLLGMALVLGIGTELLKADIIDPGRMNTVFQVLLPRLDPVRSGLGLPPVATQVRRRSGWRRSMEGVVDVRAGRDGDLRPHLPGRSDPGPTAAPVQLSLSHHRWHGLHGTGPLFRRPGRKRSYLRRRASRVQVGPAGNPSGSRTMSKVHPSSSKGTLPCTDGATGYQCTRGCRPSSAGTGTSDSSAGTSRTRSSSAAGMSGPSTLPPLSTRRKTCLTNIEFDIST